MCVCPFSARLPLSNGGLSKLTTFEKSVLSGELGFPIPVFGFNPKTLQSNLSQSSGLYHKAAILIRSGHALTGHLSDVAENPAADVHCSQRRIFSVSLPSDLIVTVGEKRVAGNVGVRRCYSTGRKTPRVPVIPLIMHSAPPLSPSPSPSPASIHQ